MVTKNDIAKAINELGLHNSPVCIHSSLKSFGHIDGGSETLIQAFLDAECTLLAPSFSYDYEVFPPLNMRPERNGVGDYSSFEEREYSNSKIFSIDSTDISKENMGNIPYTIVNMSGRKRGYNPLNSFVAIGKLADILVKDQTFENVYTPFHKLCKLNGFVLLMGTGLDSATILHYAEQKAGRNLFIRWAYNQQGRADMVSVGSCSAGFNNFEETVKSIEQVTDVGKSHWRCFSASDIVHACKNAIKHNPQISHCSDPNCDRCNDIIAGGPIFK